MPFRFTGLPLEPFVSYFGMTDAELVASDVKPLIADSKPGYPCRITLEDAEPGECVLLLSFPHLPGRSPYKASGPIFVRACARQSYDGTDVPPVLRDRLLSLRAYDAGYMMVDAEIVEGNVVEGMLERLLARRDVASVHIHNARRGCFACAVDRL